MSLHGQLIDQAIMLATRRGKARSADLKRATSAIYYAAFHFFSEKSANILVGKKHKNSVAWLRLYRAIDHARAKQVFQRYIQDYKNYLDDFPIEKKLVFEFALLFVELQALRHQADYDPRPGPLSRLGVIALAKRLEAVIAVYDLVEVATLLELTTSILFKDRN